MSETSARRMRQIYATSRPRVPVFGLTSGRGCRIRLELILKESPMQRRIVVAGVVWAAVGMLAAPAWAQRWGRPSTPRDGACFYQDANYAGDYFCVRGGDEYRSVPNGLNDGISSIRIFGRAEVTVYQHDRFKGRSKRFDEDVRNLRREGWNDRISSLRVEGGFGGGTGWSGNGGGWGNRPPGNVDRIIRRAYRDVLDREPDPAGLRLYRSRMLDDGWSEGQVRDALRNSPEYQQQSAMTWQKAEEIVRRAYQNVLHRDPDAGARGYVEKVHRSRWTQADVERELRRSPEARRR